MAYEVQIREVEAQPIAVVRGSTSRANLTKTIGTLFGTFYKDFKSSGEFNIINYSGNCTPAQMDIECGVITPHNANSQTPAGQVATTTYYGPYDQMAPAHAAIHEWCKANGRKLAGPSWEVYGHWSDDPTKLRTDIFYLLA